jgi:hypothetical protein
LPALHRTKIWLLPAAFTVVAGIAVLRTAGSWAAVRQVSISWPDLLLAAALYPVFAALRGLRFRMLLSRPLSLREAVGMGWLYSAACSILPGGLGEASLPAIYGGVAEATAALVTTRVQDLLSWLVVLVGAGFWAGRVLPAGAAPLLLLALALTLAGALVAFVPPVRRTLFGLAAPLPKVYRFLTDMDAGLSLMARDGDSWAATFALRLLSVLKYYFALRAFGAPVTPGMAAIGGALLALLLALPIQGLAGFGTMELWWVAALALFAIPGQAALVAALGTHLVLLVMSVACGGAALAGHSLKKAVML